MSAQPQETEKHRRRKPRKAPADANSASEPGQTDESAPRSRQRNSNKKKNAPQHESALSQELQNAGAATPPRSAGGSSGKHAPENDETGQEVQKSTRKRRNNNQQHNNNQQGNAAQGNDASTPGPKQRRQHTPSKPPVMMDAYAGPTFHASPAPSALPMPKLFSKSAPQIDQDVGLSARMQRAEANNSSGSDDTPESPSRRVNARAIPQNTKANGPALFDMLMNADRMEKARQLQNQGPDSAQDSFRVGSDSPHHTQSLHRPKHSRTLTDSQIFPFDGSTGNAPSPSADRSTPANNLGSPYGHPPQPRPVSGDQHLQRMLFSSPQQNLSPNNHYNGSPGAWNSSPGSYGTRSPYGSPASPNGLAASSRAAPVSPYTQASASPSARRPGYPPANNSNLRRELAHTPPYLGNIPRHGGAYAGESPLASPVQQRFGNQSPFDRDGSPAADNNHKRFSAQDAIASLGDGASMSEMEDKLRRILKIDQLRHQGPPGASSSGAVTS